MAGSTTNAGEQHSDVAQSPRNLRQLVALAGIVMAAVLMLAASSAFADDESPASDSGPSLQEIEAARQNPGPNEIEIEPTDPEAAEQLPHTGLGRDEAIELLRSVFNPELQGAAGIFDELEVERFGSDHVALIAPGDQPGAAEGGNNQATLLESSLPLRTESEAGDKEVVDLSLEHTEGELQPSSPLVEVGVPSNLNEGISLPESGIEIRLLDAPADRSPSTVADRTAVYPNVATDTDFTVAPTPTGVETMTQLRSADAPRSETFDLTIPDGASLKETEDGGAVVTSGGGKALLTIPAPSALDAKGNQVSVQLETEGSSITITAVPDDKSAYPILVDPIYQAYQWGQLNAPGDYNGWTSYSNSANFWAPQAEWCAACNGNVWALYLESAPGTVPPQSNARWEYHVPRWSTDPIHPTSYILNAKFEQLYFDTMSSLNGGKISTDPFMELYIWSDKYGFVSISHHYGNEGMLTDLSRVYPLPNPNHVVDAQRLSAELVTTSWGTQYRHLYIGESAVELTDDDYPHFGVKANETKWVNNTLSVPIPFIVSDNGLGVYQVSVGENNKSGQLQQMITRYGACSGGNDAPCPLSWSSEAGPALNYDPSIMPQGEDWVTLSATDPLNHNSSLDPSQPLVQEARIRVDHTAPALALSGTVTEQEKLGTTQPEYTLKYNATDGYAAAPTALAPFGSSGSGNGQLNGPRGIAADKKGHVWVVDRANNRVEQFNESSEYLGKFGSTGSGNGQFNSPSDITVTESGNLWVTDTGNARVQEFNSKGEYMQQFGTYGKGELGFFEPTGVAAAPGGMIWIADFANRRVAEYKETPGSSGERFVRNLGGSLGTDFNGPNGLAVDAQGNVFVADAVNNRIEKFNSSGQYLTQFGTLTSGEGQMKGPTSITIAPTGNLLVADSENNRIAEFQPSGAFIRTFGSLGTGNAQLSGPRGVAFGAGNTLFVADKGNNRIARWSNVDLDPQSGVAKVEVKLDGQVVKEEAPGCPTRDCELVKEWPLKSSQYVDGAHTVKVTATDGVGLTTTKEIPIVLRPDRTPPTLALSGSMTEQASLGTTRPRYILNLKASDPGSNPSVAFSSAFGATGTGNGQFSHPADVAVDSKGNLWTVDENNNRIEKFNEKGEFLAKYGSTGTGNGQLSRPTSLAIDPKGNIWVADAGNNRIEKFSESGAFLKTVGAPGTGNGQFTAPEGIAADPKGNIWVADTYNGRIQKFNENGEFQKVVGTKGTGTGQLIEPTGIDIGPGGNVWVTDWSNNKVVEFNEAGAYVRQFGSSGTGNGQFAHPDAIAVDSKGGVWVGDQNNSRIEEFNENGGYLLQFGSNGSGTGQFSFSYPMGMGTDTKGNIWVADTNNNRVQKWSVAEGTSSGVASTTIKVDGKVVDATSPGCPSGGCSISREWILNSSSTATGQHTAEVIATDAAGLTTTKSQTFNIAKDTTAPQITANASLYTAPEGWVEQQSYPYTASAADPGGYGSTSLALKIDGKAVKTVSQSCPDGACPETLSGSINMASYEGGAHPAELIATDGAGNTSKKAWTINVDPEGHVSAEEATATLEAVDATSPVNTVGPPKQEEEYEGTASGLGIEEVSGQLVATGTEVPTTISPQPSGGVTMQILESGALTLPCEEAQDESGEQEEEAELSEGESEPIEPCETRQELEEQFQQATESAEGIVGSSPIEITPLDTEGTGGANQIVGEIAAVGANTSEHVDTIVRPLYDGSMLFEDIRDPLGPETFSWEVNLSEEMEMKQIDDQHVAVYYEGGHVACGIAAEPAHDAIGSAVPTSLSISEGNVITLTVHHHAASPAGGGFVYPVIAGTGWEGGFHTYEIELPPEPQEEESEEEETGSSANQSGGALVVRVATQGPPIPDLSHSGEYEPQPLSLLPVAHKFNFRECRYDTETDPTQAIPPIQTRMYVESCRQEIDIYHLVAGLSVHGWFHYKWLKWVWINKRELNCDKWGSEQPAKIHCERRPVQPTNGTLNVLGDYRFPPGKGEFFAGPAACDTVWGSVYPDAHQQQEISILSPASVGEPCSWP